jgi:hypothetical protein
LRAARPHRLRGLLKIGAVAGDQHQRGKIAREALRRRLADTLAGAGDDRD